MLGLLGRRRPARRVVAARPGLARFLGPGMAGSAQLASAFRCKAQYSTPVSHSCATNLRPASRGVARPLGGGPAGHYRRT